jgi:hypothetical protein
VNTTVNRYKPGGIVAAQRGWGSQLGITHWEMWNEPDFSFFWNGTINDYARLLQVGYLAARAADLNAKVLFGGLMYWEKPDWLSNVLSALQTTTSWSSRALSQANNYYFDVLPWHWYGYPDELYQVVVGARKLLEQRGIRGKQLWVNEANLPVCGDPLVRGPTACEKLKFFGSVNEQAAYVWQLFALGFAAGLDRIFVFQLYDDGAGEKGERFGLVRNDHSRRPSYLAYQMAAHYFRDVTWANRGMEGPTNTVTLLTKDKRVMVLWNESPTPATVKVAATGSNAQLIKEDGRAWLLRPDNGMHEVLLPETPPRTVGLLRVAPIGSTAFMLVEDTPIRRQ